MFCEFVMGENARESEWNLTGRLGALNYRCYY